MTTSSTIRFSNVWIAFNGIPLFSNLNFEVHQGEKILFYGRSGIGKTSILRILLGFTGIGHGAVFFNDQPITRKNIWAIRRQIAYVSQDLDIGEGNVADLIQEFLAFRANSHLKITKQKLYEQLDLMRLDPGILNKDYIELSGGEKQRVLLVIVLLLNRPIIFLDEPTAFLDMAMKKKVIQYFIDCPATVLAVGHDPQWLDYPNIKVIDLERNNANA